LADTEPSDVVRQPPRDADMMVCMYSDERSVMKSNNEHRGRCSTNGAGQLAQEAGVKQLVLVHMDPTFSRDTPIDRLYEEMAPMYDGKIFFSEELMRIDV
jgi:ribonuclease BN (tRNA processing enzyme)